MGWGLVPEKSPYKQEFNKIFSEKPELKDKITFKHLYKVGYWYHDEKGKLQYQVMSTGLTWNECFERLDNG